MRTPRGQLCVNSQVPGILQKNDPSPSNSHGALIIRIKIIINVELFTSVYSPSGVQGKMILPF